VDNVSFELHRHEILGFGGLKGAGGESVLKAIMALEKPLECNMELQGNTYCPKSSYDAKKKGISYLPGNRLEEGLIPDFAISDNIVLPNIPNNKGILDKNIIQEETKRLQQMVLIKSDNLKNPCTSLSGGNMQKVVIAKCLVSNPSIILLNNPTRGIDVGARHEIYHLIEKLAEEGLSFILLSEDLVELIGLSDRVLVFNKGKVKHEFNTTKSLTEKDVVSQMI
jgi:ribose transport system ATP-binding protein